MQTKVDMDGGYKWQTDYKQFSDSQPTVGLDYPPMPSYYDVLHQESHSPAPALEYNASYDYSHRYSASQATLIQAAAPMSGQAADTLPNPYSAQFSHFPEEFINQPQQSHHTVTTQEVYYAQEPSQMNAGLHAQHREIW